MPNATNDLLLIGAGVAYNSTTILAGEQISPKIIWNKVQVSVPTTILLPPAASVPGQLFLLTNAGSTALITIQDAGGATINGQGFTQLSRPFQSVELISDGTQWFIKAAAG